MTRRGGDEPHFISLEITVSSTQTLKGAHSVKQGREEADKTLSEIEQ